MVTRTFLFATTVSRPVVGPTQPPIQWVLGAFSLVVSNHSIKLHLHSLIHIHGVVLN